MKKVLFVISGFILANTINKATIHAQIVATGVNNLTLTYEGHGNPTQGINISPLSVSAGNGYTAAAPFVFADISSSVHTFSSPNSPFTSLFMTGNHVDFHTGGVTLTPISFQISLAVVDNGNGAYVRFNANIPFGTGATGGPTYDYINIRKGGNGMYYYKANR